MRPLNRSFLLISAFSLSLVFSSTAFASAMIENGSFQTGDFTDWTASNSGCGGVCGVIGGDFEIVEQANAPQGWFVYDGNTYAAQLGTAGPPNSSLSQTFADTLGQMYTLTFWLNGDTTIPGDTNDLSVSVAGVNLNLGDVTTAWSQYSLTFKGTGDDTVAFSFFDNGDYLSLDDVAVASVASATPEPSSLLLLATGVCGLVAMGRRKLFAV
jgi:hypothetical protein